MSKLATVEVGFGNWLKLSWEYGDLIPPTVMMGLLMLGSALLPVVGIYLSVCLGLAFLLSLYYAWRRDLRSPPWYIREALKIGEAAHN